jgi:hypothetical protein
MPPARESSLQEPPAEGWDLSEPPAREVSIPVDLTARKPDLAVNPRARDPSIAVDLSELDSHAKEPSLVPAGVPRGRGRRWLIFFALLLVAAAGIWRREQLRPVIHRLLQRIVTTTRAL